MKTKITLTEEQIEILTSAKKEMYKKEMANEIASIEAKYNRKIKDLENQYRILSINLDEEEEEAPVQHEHEETSFKKQMISLNQKLLKAKKKSNNDSKITKLREERVQLYLKYNKVPKQTFEDIKLFYEANEAR